MVVQNVLNYHENNFIMQEIPKRGFGYLCKIQFLIYLLLILWWNSTWTWFCKTFAVTIPAIVLWVFSSCYSYQARSILGIFAVSYPDQPHQISSELLSRMKCEGWHWFESVPDFPKESYNSNTQTDHHYKPLCNNTNGSVSTLSCQRDTSIRLIRMVIWFALVLYKRKKNSIPFVFPVLFLSFLLICHEVWPELLFICRPGWSFFHSCRFLHGLCVSMPVCPCNIFAQRRNTGGLRLWRTHGMEALLSSSVSGQYTDGLMLLVSDGCAFYLFKNWMKEKWLLNILQQQQESYLALVTYRL